MDVVGYTLHPLDLAANKLSALVGRTEPRDWIDVITCIRRLQPLVYLLSAACGKDPGFSPSSMLEYVARRHYNQVEVDAKIAPAGMYDAAMLCRLWHEEVDSARKHILEFPRDKAGMCVLDRDGNPYKGDPSSLSAAIAYAGSGSAVRGVWRLWMAVRAAGARSHSTSCSVCCVPLPPRTGWDGHQVLTPDSPVRS